jgi:hypothetical protein
MFCMKHNKLWGPYGFHVEFYQTFWGLVKTGLYKLFQDFYDGKLDISRLIMLIMAFFIPYFFRMDGVVNWVEVCQPKDQSDVGVTNCNCKNISLLCKWIWKLKNGDGDW